MSSILQNTSNKYSLVQIVESCIYSIDGNWKVCYPLCMMQVRMDIQGFQGECKYVDHCPNEPEPGKALCYQHCMEANEKGISCDLKDYVKFPAKKCQDSFSIHHANFSLVYLNHCRM